MKILLTGCKGQLGLELIKQFNSCEGVYTIIETDIHNLDITDQKQVLELVEAEKPECIINCAAYTNVDGCESNEIAAFKANFIGAQNLSASAYRVGAKIVQISTDYVFNGESNRPMREYDSMNPQSCYGKSKALGEKIVAETNPKHYILRTAWLYGEGNNFVRTMLKLSKEKDEISVVDDQIGSPTSTVDLTRCIINLIHTESYGIYHATCEGYCSWYDFAKKIFELKGINIRVNKTTTDQLDRPAKRPKYSVLENFTLKLLGLNSFRNWEESLKEYLAKET